MTLDVRVKSGPLVDCEDLHATGWDRDAETWLLDHSPDWLTRLTTRY